MRRRWLLCILLCLTGCAGPCGARPGRSPTAGEPLLDDSGRVDAGGAHAFDELFSEDREAAIRCALDRTWTELDHREMGRVVSLLWPEIDRPRDEGDHRVEVDFEELRSMIGSSELPSLLADLPEPDPPETLGYMLSNLHRQVRADHLPQLLRTALADDREFVRGEILQIVSIALNYTDRHREEVARALLAMHPEPGAPALVEPVSPEPGYPFLLARALRRFAVPDGPDSPWRSWLYRWMRASVPGPKDARLLLRLSASGDEEIHTAALLGMAELQDEATWAALTRRNEPAALAARARRGDDTAGEELVRRAAGDPEALALLLAWLPEEGRRFLRARLLGPGERAAGELLATLEDLETSRHVLALDWPAAVFDGFAEEALARRLPAWRLARIAVLVPGCRLRTLAREVCRLWNSYPPGALPATGLSAPLAFLDSATPELLREVLRPWLSSGVSGVRSRAARLLFMAGDPASGDAALQWVRAQRYVEDWMVRRLAYSGNPAIEQWLRHRDELQALAVLHGLDPAVGFDHLLDRVTDATRDAFREHLLDGRPVDALIALLEDPDGVPIWDVGLVQKPRVRDALRRIRENRGSNLYAWATGELAVQGDHAAREEMRAVFETGRYRWVDNAGPIQMTFGRELGMVPLWFDELETNCCRFNVVAETVEEMLGLDLQDHRRNSGRHAADVCRRYWAEHGGRFVWSDVVGHFIPEPR